MAKTIHFLYGCPWADGEIQQSDTWTTCDWKKVTCKHCNKGYGRQRRAERDDWDAKTDTVKPEFRHYYDD